MSLQDLHEKMSSCIRCSSCKFIPTAKIQGQKYATSCPSIEFGNFHTYSGGGKMITALGLVEQRIDYTDELLRSVNACSMCGACDVSCKVIMGDMVEPMEVMRELRLKLVEDGQVDPGHMVAIDGLKNEDNVFGAPRAERGQWAEGLDIPDAMETPVDVFLHVGCRYSYDRELWPVVRGAVRILQAAGLKVGFARREEVCNGGRAYEMGYKGVFESYAESMVGRVRQSGAKYVVTPCADCFGTFNQLYPANGFGFGNGVEVVHMLQLIERAIESGRVKLKRKVPLKVTYHDPCHLGRTGERLTPWQGTTEQVLNKLLIRQPAKDVSFGNGGIYDTPRNILRRIPGVELVEMERIREYTYCCGAGGGCLEAYPDMAQQAGMTRVEEGRSTGAQALVTSCPWCVRNFRDSMGGNAGDFSILDVTQLVMKSMGLKEEDSHASE